MEKTIHIWEFPNVSVKISDSFLEEIKKKINSNFKSQRNFYLKLNLRIPFTSFKNMLKYSNPYFIPINILLICCKKLNISKYYIEKQIIAYRSSKGRRTITNPRLPIKISPLFYMLLAHIMADGNCIRIKNKTPYFSYRQYDKEILNSFAKKVRSQFGEIDIKISEDRIYLPATISMCMANKANIKPKEFLSNIARIPKNWFRLKKKNLLAILLAFIIDEGHIDSSQIVIGLYNKGLLKDLKNICNICNYTSSLKNSRLYILADGVKKLWRDYINLKNKFPNINLGYKEKQIKEFIIRKNKIYRSRQQGQTKNQIIFLLKNKRRTINELATILKISRQGVRFHIKELHSKDIISKEGIAKNSAVIYKLNKEYKFKVIKSRISKQEEVTKKEIIRLIEEKPRTSIYLANKLNIHRSTILTFLYNLEKKGIIERNGKKKIKTHPAIIWKINKQYLF